MQTLFIEIGTEELPPTRLDKLGQAWLDLFLAHLEKEGVPFGASQFFIAPRRMAVMIKDVPSKLEAKSVQRRGPSIQAAFDAEGNPTQAAIGFASSNQTTVENLERLSTNKGEWLVFNFVEQGKTIEDVVPDIVKTTLAKLPIPKRMRWGNYDAEFIRPVHWCVALHGSTVIPFEIFNVKSSNQSYGHRFHHPEAITIEQADDYANIMRKAYVIADYQQRADHIRTQSIALGESLGATTKIDPELLDLVTGLNEWPKPMLASFDAAFLDVPQEALITAMQHHQKCFPVIDTSGKLMNQFVLTANTDAEPADLILHGNERVMHARLNDAKFFYIQDCKRPLEDHLEQLKLMVFQKKLGSLYDKTQRIKKLSKNIASRFDAPIHHVERAAILIKCDLLTEMVGEFPELQGIMGYYYALEHNEAEEVALSLKEAYLPRFSGDVLPSSATGICLSLADKLDTMVGIFGLGKAPTGDKDPFGLRRAALGVLRIIVENALDLDLKDILLVAVKGYQNIDMSEGKAHEVLSFCFERFRAWYQEKGISSKVLDAVMSSHTPSKPLDFAKRVEAVNHFQSLPQAEALAAANKRVRNILTKSGFKIDFNHNPSINADKLLEEEERNLFEMMRELDQVTKPFMANGEYTQTLTTLAQLKEPVDSFFDKVMVNVEDEATRQNRVNLLSNLHNLFGQIADISRL